MICVRSASVVLYGMSPIGMALGLGPRVKAEGVRFSPFRQIPGYGIVVVYGSRTAEAVVRFDLL